VSTYQLIEVEKAAHSVPTLFRMLGVSRSGYYAWRSRQPSERARFDAMLSETIETIHRNSRATYGAPRVHAELGAIGIRCSRKRVARLMHRAKLRGSVRGRGVKTTYRIALQQAAPDLVESNFVSEEPDRLWVADITYVCSAEGFVYLALILDVCSRRVVGMVDGNTSENGDRRGRLADGDREAQASSGTGAPLRPWGTVHLFVLLQKARGRREEPFDGPGGLGLRQRPGGELRRHLEDGASLPRHLAHQTGDQVRFSAEYIEGFYNTRRRHSALGYLSPAEFEEVTLVGEDAA
jgi:putative transposase